MYALFVAYLSITLFTYLQNDNLCYHCSYLSFYDYFLRVEKSSIERVYVMFNYRFSHLYDNSKSYYRFSNLTFGANDDKSFDNNKLHSVDNLSKNQKTASVVALSSVAVGGAYLVKGQLAKLRIKKLEKYINNKGLTVNRFKKLGNFFDKGRAKLANGDFYSGLIGFVKKDGSVVEMDYINGFLQQSSNILGKNLLSVKKYLYNASDRLSKIVDDENRTLFVQKFKKKVKFIRNTISGYAIDLKSSKITWLGYNLRESGTKRFIYNDDGILKFINHKFLKNGRHTGRIFGFYPDGKNLRFIREGEGATVLFDRKSNIVDKIHFDSTDTSKCGYRFGCINFKPKNYDNEFQTIELIDDVGENAFVYKFNPDNNHEVMEFPEKYSLTRDGFGHVTITDKSNAQVTEQKQFNKILGKFEGFKKFVLVKNAQADKIRCEISNSEDEYLYLLGQKVPEYPQSVDDYVALMLN